jgi:hypothetical protein
MIFVDESSKDNQTIYQHYGHSLVGTCATISTNFVWGKQYSMIAALSLDGYEAVHIVSGSIDGAEFLDYIINDIVYLMFYLFSFSLTCLPAAKYEPLPLGQEHLDS